MHILDLPSEIIQRILDHLDSRHLYESAFVCKNWNIPALQRWYTYNLCLDDVAFKTVMGLLKYESEERVKYFQYAPLVKCLNFRIPMPPNGYLDTLWEPYIKDFLRCLEYFPNILVLDIQNFNFAYRCYELIASSPPIRALKNIQEIGSAEHIMHQNFSGCDHFKACYLYRTTITKIATTYIKNLLDGRDSFVLLKDFTRLSELKLHIDFKSWLNEVGVDNAVRFAERLSKLNRFQLSWPAFNERSEVLQDGSGSSLKNFFKFVKAFQTDNTFVRSTFVTYSDIQWNSFLYSYIKNRPDLSVNWIEYNSKTGYNFQYKFEYTDLNYFKTKSGNTHVRQNATLTTEKDGLEKLNFIKFNLIDDDFNPDGLFEILQLVLIHCPKLEFYQHTSSSEDNVSFNHMIIGADLTHFGTDQQVEYYHQRSTETKENLRSVKFDNILPSQELLDLLSTHLPNIEIIAVLRSDPDHVRSKESAIDLIGFKELDSVYFEIEILPDFPVHYFVRLQYIDDDEPYYYYHTSEYYKSLVLVNGEFFNMCLDRVTSMRIVTIKCKKDIKVTIGAPDVGVIAEIVNGCQLSYISDDSHKNYKLLSDGFKQLK